VIIPYRARGGPDEPKRPWLELYIGGQLVPFYGLVDSGSDYSVSPRALARRIGISFDESDPENGSAAGGATFVFFEQTNDLQFRPRLEA
jgi:aspartyl protease